MVIISIPLVYKPTHNYRDQQLRCTTVLEIVYMIFNLISDFCALIFDSKTDLIFDL